MPLIPCPECSAQISDKAKACPKCGVPIEKKETKVCFECKSEVEKDKTTCPNCGVDFSLETKTEEPIKKNNNAYTCKYCGAQSDHYSEFCPNCKLNLAGFIKPGTYQCKFCGHRSETWSENCQRCQRDINGNIKGAPIAQPIIIQNIQKKKGGVVGIIIFGFLGIILVLAGIAINNQMHSFNGELDQFGNYMQGNSRENQMMGFVATGSMVVGGIFLLISLIKLIKR